MVHLLVHLGSIWIYFVLLRAASEESRPCSNHLTSREDLKDESCAAAAGQMIRSFFTSGTGLVSPVLFHPSGGTHNGMIPQVQLEGQDIHKWYIPHTGLVGDFGHRSPWPMCTIRHCGVAQNLGSHDIPRAVSLEIGLPQRPNGWPNGSGIPETLPARMESHPIHSHLLWQLMLVSDSIPICQIWSEIARYLKISREIPRYLKQ